MSFYLPSPCLPGSQSMNKPLSSVLGHLLPALIWTMKTGDEDTGWWPLICVRVVSSTGGSDSDLHNTVCNTEHAVIYLLFARPSSLQSILRALYVMDVPFFFFGIFLFVFLSGKGPGIKRARGNFFYLQSRVFTGTLWTRPNRAHLPCKVVGRSALANCPIHPISQKEALLLPECESWQTDHFDQKEEIGWP